MGGRVSRSSQSSLTDHKSRSGWGNYTTPRNWLTCSLPLRFEPLMWWRKQARACGIPTMLKQLLPFPTVWQPVCCFCFINKPDSIHTTSIIGQEWVELASEPAWLNLLSQEPRVACVVNLWWGMMSRWTIEETHNPEIVKIYTLCSVYWVKNNSPLFA